ncbi:MAG: histidine phosphatase family protein [Bdellovibrionales bacterium]
MSASFFTYFIRHGEKDPNTKIDPPLTLRGCLQAMRTGQFLAAPTRDKMLRGAEIIVSPYKRTLQTAVLALAQKDWGDNVPQIILDPLISETISNPNCVGSKKDELVQWLKEDGFGQDGLKASLYKAVNDAIAANVISFEESQKILTRIDVLLANMDSSEIENCLKQDWWPKGTLEGGYESEADAQNRHTILKKKYPDQNFVLFTHSTFIADTFRKMRPIKTFDQGCESTIGVPKGRLSEDWHMSQIDEAGLYEIEASSDNYTAWNNHHAPHVV